MRLFMKEEGEEKESSLCSSPFIVWMVHNEHSVF